MAHLSRFVDREKKYREGRPNVKRLRKKIKEKRQGLIGLLLLCWPGFVIQYDSREFLKEVESFSARARCLFIFYLQRNRYFRRLH